MKVPLASGITIIFGEFPDRYDSVLVVLRHRGNLVLARNSKRRWEFPGGHCELGEDWCATARREAFEEAGADISPPEMIGHYVLPNGHVTVITSAEALSLSGLSGAYETIEVKTFSALPTDISWGDGLYERLLEYIANRPN